MFRLNKEQIKDFFTWLEKFHKNYNYHTKQELENAKLFIKINENIMLSDDYFSCKWNEFNIKDFKKYLINNEFVNRQYIPLSAEEVGKYDYNYEFLTCFKIIISDIHNEDGEKITPFDVGVYDVDGFNEIYDDYLDEI